MHPLEIESRATPWKGVMLPLHHGRRNFLVSAPNTSGTRR